MVGRNLGGGGVGARGKKEKAGFETCALPAMVSFSFSLLSLKLLPPGMKCRWVGGGRQRSRRSRHGQSDSPTVLAL